MWVTKSLQDQTHSIWIDFSRVSVVLSQIGVEIEGSIQLRRADRRRRRKRSIRSLETTDQMDAVVSLETSRSRVLQYVHIMPVVEVTGQKRPGKSEVTVPGILLEHRYGIARCRERGYLIWPHFDSSSSCRTEMLRMKRSNGSWYLAGRPDEHIVCGSPKSSKVDMMIDPPTGVPHATYSILTREGHISFTVVKEVKARNAQLHYSKFITKLSGRERGAAQVLLEECASRRIGFGVVTGHDIDTTHTLADLTQALFNIRDLRFPKT
ncbi:hypothetical protein J3A83DRAFT_4185753 [Scleroderma citrinum]